jgi:hypothetical protein
VKGTKFVDRMVLGGLSYAYHVKAYDASGHSSPPSQTIRIELPIPAYDETAHA